MDSLPCKMPSPGNTEEDRESISSVHAQIISSSPRSYRGVDEPSPKRPRSDQTHNEEEEEDGENGSSRRVDELELSPKRPRSSSESQCQDRISALPDPIIHQILSFLTIEEAIRTCVLSKRWKLSWTFVPNIGLCNRLGSDRGPDFVAFVDKTLMQYSSCNVKNFLVAFDYRKRYASHVDTWVHFATRHCVQKLYLYFDLIKKLNRLRDFIKGSHHYLLPQSFCTNSSIKVLTLRFCKFAPETNVCWTNLKVLRIDYANLRNAVILNILLGSPMLKELSLNKFVCIENLDINSTSLKKLELDANIDIWAEMKDSTSIISISAPNLKSLCIRGFMSRKKFLLTNVSSLVEAEIRFYMTSTRDDYINNSYENHCKLLAELLERLGHVKHLIIGTWCLQVLSIMEVKTLPSPLSKCKRLVLKTQLNKWDLPGIASLLQSSSNLEKLVINMTPWLYNFPFEFETAFTNTKNFDDENYWRSQKSKFKCLLLRLKIVKITGFKERSSGLKFIIGLLEFLVRNARVLEKVIIYGVGETCKQPRILKEASGLHEVTQLLNLLQSACPNAVGVFK